MTQYVLPIVFTLSLWWLSTGIVLIAVNMKRATYPWTMLAATFVLAAALAGIAWTSDALTVTNVYVAFLCGLLIWGWNEMSYFMGLITGPRPHACPPKVSRLRQFWLAVQASLFHELAILGFLGLLVVITWDAPNQVGLWTFVILWLMRWSAKLNIFLGVPNVNLQFFPEHLRYLESFIIKKRINVLFPVSVMLSSIVAVLVLAGAVGTQAGPAEVAASLLLGSLITLAIIEHFFMVLPLHDAVLWRWAKRTDEPTTPGPTVASADAPVAQHTDNASLFSAQPLAGFDSISGGGSTPPRPAITTSGR